jgi:coenzyme F420-0:L-glutamate ligase/coenzyme F420-1:gamma-L-glutamate ligase
MSQESAPGTIVIHPLTGLPEIQPGDDLVALIVAALARVRLTIATGDVLVVTQKIVSKAEDRLIALDSVVPSAEARQWAEAWAKDARVVELVLRETARIVKMERGLIIAETRRGYIERAAGMGGADANRSGRRGAAYLRWCSRGHRCAHRRDRLRYVWTPMA